MKARQKYGTNEQTEQTDFISMMNLANLLELSLSENLREPNITAQSTGINDTFADLSSLTSIKSGIALKSSCKGNYLIDKSRFF